MGSIAELGGLCSFYRALQSVGSDTTDSFFATTNIKRKGVNVRASLADVALKKLNGTNGSTTP